jgi:elongation factor P
MYSGNELRKEVLIEQAGVPFRVVEAAHHATGRGGGVVRTKLKNLITGAVLEKTFRPTDKIPAAQIDRLNMQYLYREGNDAVLMNQTTFDQLQVSFDILGDGAGYMAEGSEVTLFEFNGKVIGVDMPNNVYLKITHTEPGIKGDTASTTLKEATVETGARVMVPLFINEGDVIKVDTRSGAYLERQK